MTDQISGGHFLVAKKIDQSAIWRKPPQYIKLLIWLIRTAVFQDGYTFKGHVLKRGELIKTHDEIADALSYRFNRKIIKPTVKEIRIMLSWLQSEGMISMKPIIDGTLPNKGRPTDRTRAYIGLLIFIINYDTYQDSKSYKGRDKGRPSSEQGQVEKEGEKEKNIYRENALQILAYLNEKTGKQYRDTSSIEARLKDGGSVDDCRKIIDTKMQDPHFLNNPKYLNPQTLFRKLHWDTYVNESFPSAVGKMAAPPPPPLKCPRCGRELVVKNDLYGAGCIHCERSIKARV